jgi:hypothetical protein
MLPPCSGLTCSMFSETYTTRTSLCNKPYEHDLNSHSRENLKSYNNCSLDIYFGVCYLQADSWLPTKSWLILLQYFAFLLCF